MTTTATSIFAAFLLDLSWPSVLVFIFMENEFSCDCPDLSDTGTAAKQNQLVIMWLLLN